MSDFADINAATERENERVRMIVHGSFSTAFVFGDGVPFDDETDLDIEAAITAILANRERYPRTPPFIGAYLPNDPELGYFTADDLAEALDIWRGDESTPDDDDLIPAEGRYPDEGGRP